MKRANFRLAPAHALRACAFALALSVAPAAYGAQEQPVQPPVKNTSAPPAPSPSATPSPQGAASSTQPVSREQRALSYAKLLEGQRYLSAARNSGGITRDSLRAAQQAFQQAAEINPALAEAHTALAEIAFFFLEDMLFI